MWWRGREDGAVGGGADGWMDGWMDGREGEGRGEKGMEGCAREGCLVGGGGVVHLGLHLLMHQLGAMFGLRR